MMASTCTSGKTMSGPFQKYHEALSIFNRQGAPGKTAPPKATADDDKYSKMSWAKTPVHDKNGSGYYEKYHSAPLFALIVFKIQSVLCKAVPAVFALFGSSSFRFACMYVLVGLAYTLLGGQPSSNTGTEKVLNLMSISMEVFGLLILRHKIQVRNSVAGVSGMTMLMYAACYTIRTWLSMPDSLNFNFMELELEASFGVCSLLLVLDCLRSIFVTHRKTYQSDLDVLHVKYLIPGCFFLAALIRAHFHSWTPLFGYIWTSCLYIDVLALIPQVVMMARGGGRVAAPIAHFVAATFFSRIEDLMDSLLYKTHMDETDDFFSYTVVVFFQAVHLLIVADFMYYYVKALSSGAGLQKDMEMSVSEV